MWSYIAPVVTAVQRALGSKLGKARPNSAAAARFVVRSDGAIVHRRAGRNHNTGKRRRSYVVAHKEDGVLKGAALRQVRRLLCL